MGLEWRKKKRQARADCVQPSQAPTSNILNHSKQSTYDEDINKCSIIGRRLVVFTLYQSQRSLLFIRTTVWMSPKNLTNNCRGSVSVSNNHPRPHVLNFLGNGGGGGKWRSRLGSYVLFIPLHQASSILCSLSSFWEENHKEINLNKRINSSLLFSLCCLTSKSVWF